MKRASRLFMIAVVLCAAATTLTVTGPSAATAEAPKPVEVVNTPTVQVANPFANPALVLDVSRDRLVQPSQLAATCPIQPGDSVCFINFGIPPDKAMVVDFVSVSAVSDLIEQHRFRATITGTFFSVPLALEPLGTFPFGLAVRSHFLVNQPIRLYARGEINVAIERSDTSGSSNATVRLIGQSLDCGPAPGFCSLP